MHSGEERYCNTCQDCVTCPVDDFSCPECGAITAGGDDSWCKTCEEWVERTLNGCPKCGGDLREPIQPTHYCAECERWLFPGPDATPGEEECPECGSPLSEDGPEDEE